MYPISSNDDKSEPGKQIFQLKAQGIVLYSPLYTVLRASCYEIDDKCVLISPRGVQSICPGITAENQEAVLV